MMPTRDGGKFRGTHTTFSDLAAKVADTINALDEVTGISPGILQSGKGVTSGMRKVKIADMTGGLRLTVRQSRSVQELRIYTATGRLAKLSIAKALREKDIPISFRKD